MDSVKIVQDLQSAVTDLKKADDDLKRSQEAVTEFSNRRQNALNKVNDLRAALDRSLNEQLEAAGVSQSRPGVVVR